MLFLYFANFKGVGFWMGIENDYFHPFRCTIFTVDSIKTVKIPEFIFIFTIFVYLSIHFLQGAVPSENILEVCYCTT